MGNTRLTTDDGPRTTDKSAKELIMHPIKKVAVIGAGTMGGGIAAHAANAGLPVVLLDMAPADLTPEEQAKGLTLESKAVRNRIVNGLFDRVKKSRPAALFTLERAQQIQIGNLA